MWEKRKLKQSGPLIDRKTNLKNRKRLTFTTSLQHKKGNRDCVASFSFVYLPRQMRIKTGVEIFDPVLQG